MRAVLYQKERRHAKERPHSALAWWWLPAFEALAPPALDGGMVAGQQYGRHGPVVKLGGPGVVRILPGAAELRRKRIAGHAVGIGHRPLDLAHDSVEERRGRDLAAREHVGPDGDPVGDELRDALVDTFVATTQHAEVGGRQLGG